MSESKKSKTVAKKVTYPLVRANTTIMHHIRDPACTDDENPTYDSVLYICGEEFEDTHDALGRYGEIYTTKIVKPFRNSPSCNLDIVPMIEKV